MGLATDLYAQDYNDYIPCFLENNFPYKIGIYKTLLQYCKNPDIFFCPENGKNYKWGGVLLFSRDDTNANPMSYGFNVMGTGDNTGYYPIDLNSPKKATSVKVPGRLIAIADNSNYGAVNALYEISMNPNALFRNTWPTPTHNGGCNVLFADGHVEWKTIDHMCSYANEVLKLWNYENSSTVYAWPDN